MLCLAVSGTAPVRWMDVLSTPGGLGRGAVGAFASRGARVFAKPAREARFSAVVYLLQIAYNDDDILLSRVDTAGAFENSSFSRWSQFSTTSINLVFAQGGKSSKSPQIAVIFFFDPCRKKNRSFG